MVNQDALWYYWIKAAVDKNVVVYDNDNKVPGLVTKRLVALIKTMMRRDGGKLTHMSVNRLSYQMTCRMLGIPSTTTSLKLLGVDIKTLDGLRPQDGPYWKFYFEPMNGTIPSHHHGFGIALDMSARNIDMLDDSRVLLFSC